jgi:hypothetical protein
LGLASAEQPAAARRAKICGFIKTALRGKRDFVLGRGETRMRPGFQQREGNA